MKLLSRWLSADADADAILEGLTTRQHMRPHDAVAVAVDETCRKLGVCPNAAAQALVWLGVDPGIRFGRLRRTELMQLARSIHRFWQQAAGTAPPPAMAPYTQPEPA